jgi:OmpA-OmpF porin, OOP family
MSALLIAVLFSLGAEPTFELEGNTLKVPGPVVFELNSGVLKPESEPVLEHVKAYLAAKSYLSTVRVEVHTDDLGDRKANQSLSEERAAAVVRALINKGVECSRLIAVGFGGTKPITSNETPEGRTQNRRTVFVNAAIKGRPIAGQPLDGGGVVAPTPCTK